MTDNLSDRIKHYEAESAVRLRKALLDADAKLSETVHYYEPPKRDESSWKDVCIFFGLAVILCVGACLIVLWRAGALQ